MKSSTRIAVCASLLVLGVSTAMVFRHLRASTQSVDTLSLQNRYLEKQLREESTSRHIADIVRFERLFEDARLFFQHPGESIDRVALRALYDSVPVLERCIAASKENDWETLSIKAAAHENLARIWCLQSRLGDAEDELRRSLAAYSQIADSGRARIAGPGMQSCVVRIATVQSRIGWVLSATGRYEESVDIYARAVSTLESTFQSLDFVGQLELSVANRNLGLIRARSGLTGDSCFERSYEISRGPTQQLEKAAQEKAAQENGTLERMVAFALVGELHADTCQLLHAGYWRRQLYEQSEQFARESLDILQRLLPFIERTPSHCPWLRYERALLLANTNLQSMMAEKANAVTKSSDLASPLPDAWYWQPLYSMTGETVSQELLKKGHMHAEFEDNEGLVVSWMDEGWASPAIVQIVAAACRTIRVYVLVADDVHEKAARAAFLAASVPVERLAFWRIDPGTVWLRDFGPIVIESGAGRFRCLDNIYLNGERPREDFLPKLIADRLGMVAVPTNTHLSGGEFLTNGNGLCIASSIVVESNGDTRLTRDSLTSRLQRLTGAEEVVLLEPLKEEPTHHIDWFATFTSPDTVVIGDYRDLDPENAAILNRNAEKLARVQTPTGPLKVVRIPMPPRSKSFFGGTYTNVVFANGVLLVPTWPDAPQALEVEAMSIYRELLPDWKIVGIDCGKLGLKNGALHCVTINLFRTNFLGRKPEPPRDSTRESRGDTPAQ